MRHSYSHKERCTSLAFFPSSIVELTIHNNTRIYRIVTSPPDHRISRRCKDTAAINSPHPAIARASRKPQMAPPLMISAGQSLTVTPAAASCDCPRASVSLPIVPISVYGAILVAITATSLSITTSAVTPPIAASEDWPRNPAASATPIPTAGVTAVARNRIQIDGEPAPLSVVALTPSGLAELCRADTPMTPAILHTAPRIAQR